MRAASGLMTGFSTSQATAAVVFGARVQVVCVWVRARAAAAAGSGSAWLQLSSRTRGRLVIAVFHGGGLPEAHSFG